MADIHQLQPWLQPFAAALLSYMPNARVTSTYRSISDQTRLYNNRANNPYPVAPPGHSYHNYGRAFDVVDEPAVLQWAGKVWKAWGGQWFPSDPIHFQA